MIHICTSYLCFTAGTRIIFAVWLERAASPMHIVHLGYGVGGFIAPLLANPFLADIPDDETWESTTFASTTTPYGLTTNNDTEIEENFVSNIQYAYTIIGIITAGFAVIFCIYQVGVWRTSCGKFDNNENDKKKDVEEQDNILMKKRSILQMINPASCADGNFCFGFWILILLFARYFLLTGIDRVLGTFLRSYAIDQLNFSKDNASYLNTVFYITYAVGRFITFVVAFRVSVKIILVIESLGALMTGICFVIFAQDNPLSLWILTGLSGIFLGPMYPTGIAWGGAHIEMTGLATAWTLFGSAFGGLSYLRLGGYVYDEYGPPSMAYILMITVILIVVFDAILTTIGLAKKRLTGKSENLEITKTLSSPDVQIYVVSNEMKTEN